MASIPKMQVLGCTWCVRGLEGELPKSVAVTSDLGVDSAVEHENVLTIAPLCPSETILHCRLMTKM